MGLRPIPLEGPAFGLVGPYFLSEVGLLRNPTELQACVCCNRYTRTHTGLISTLVGGLAYVRGILVSVACSHLEYLN